MGKNNLTSDWLSENEVINVDALDFVINIRRHMIPSIKKDVTVLNVIIMKDYFRGVPTEKATGTLPYIEILSAELTSLMAMAQLLHCINGDYIDNNNPLDAS